MKRALLCVLVSAVGVPMVCAAQDSLVFSCTTFPPTATAGSLAGQFGADQVVTGPVSGLDDGPVEGTILFPHDPVRRVQIHWHDETTHSRPRLILLRGEFSRWQTVNGIALGQELRTLERGNGRPFRLTGFRTENSGLIQSWSGGRLEPPDTPGCRLAVSLYPPPEKDNPRGALRQVSRGVFSSGHPAMQDLNPRVVVLMLRYDRP